MSKQLPAKISAEQIDRKMRALQEMAPSPTPEQRAQLAREAESDDIKLNGVGLAILERRVAEQDALIVGQRTAIETLRGWIQECDDGVSNLGMRVAKLEDGGCNASFLRDDVLRHQIAEVRARAEKDRTWTRDLIATWRKELGHKINRLEADADKCARFRAIHPPVTEEDNDD